MKARRLIIWSSLIFGLDQLTKWWVMQAMAPGSVRVVIPNFFDLVYVLNKGAAFGMFSRLPDPYRVIILMVVALLAVGIIVSYFWSQPATARSIQIPLAMILGGALGNIFDRVIHGAVIDFLSFHWYNKIAQIDLWGHAWHFRLEWPAFNVADSAITCSVLFLLWKLVGGERRQ